MGLLTRIAELERRLAEQDRRIAELEARLKVNSTNSSRPPSANPPTAPKPLAKPPTGRKPGGQPGHSGHGRPRLPADELVQHRPAECARCHAPLSPAAGPDDPPPTWHQVFEVPTVLVHVTEHQAHGRTCTVCGHVTWGHIPAEVLAQLKAVPSLPALRAEMTARGDTHDREVRQRAIDRLTVRSPVTRPATEDKEIALTLAAAGPDGTGVTFRLNGEDQGDSEALLRAMQAARKRHEVLIIRAAREVLFRHVVTALDVPRKAGFDDVNFATDANTHPA